jgi:hypothetical protein
MTDTTPPTPAPVAPTTPRVALADALFARRGGDPGSTYDLRATLATVRDGVQRVTDAAALRQLLAGLTQAGEEDPPAKPAVDSIEKIVSIGTSLVGTPTEREKMLREEAEAERRRRQEVEDALRDLREEVWKLRTDRRVEERQDMLGLGQFMAQQTQVLVELLKDARKPPDDDVKDFLAKTAVQMMTSPPRSPVETTTETLKALKEAGLVQDPQGAVPPWLRDPTMFGHWLQYQADLGRVAAEKDVSLKKEEAATERAKALGPVAGVLGAAMLSRFAGEDAGQQAAQGLLRPGGGPSADAAAAPPADAPDRPRRQTQLIVCPQCQERFAATTGRTAYRCPNPDCGTLLTLTPPAAGQGG